MKSGVFAALGIALMIILGFTAVALFVALEFPWNVVAGGSTVIAMIAVLFTALKIAGSMVDREKNENSGPYIQIF